MRSLIRTGIAVSLTACLSLALIVQLRACPFCVAQRGPTLLGDYKQAAMVLVGRFVNAKLDAKGGLEGGTTDFAIEVVLKDHPVRKGRKVITLPRYLPNQKNRWVIFCDVFRGVIDPYRGEEITKGSKLVPYLKGLIARKDQSVEERLKWCFKFLNELDDTIVSLDAYREFAKANYSDYAEMGKQLDPDQIAGWLEDDKTPTFRYGLYGSLLGLCGKEKHAEFLRKKLDEPKVRKSSGIDGMLVGYVLILNRHNRKSEAIQYLTRILDNPKEEFLMRYAVLRTLRFFWTTRKDVFTQDEITEMVSHTLRHPDIADFGIEDLRKWERVDRAKEVLALFGKKSHDIRIIKRAILRYALALQDKSPLCREFVQQQRARDRRWVEETEELLALETTAPKKQ